MPTTSDDDLVAALEGRPTLAAKPDAVLVEQLVNALLSIEEYVNDDGEFAQYPNAVDIHVIVSQALHLVGLDTREQRNKARDG